MREGYQDVFEASGVAWKMKNGGASEKRKAAHLLTLSGKLYRNRNKISLASSSDVMIPTLRRKFIGRSNMISEDEERVRQTNYLKTRDWLATRSRSRLRIRAMPSVCSKLNGSLLGTDFRSGPCYFTALNGNRIWTFPPAKEIPNLIFALANWEKIYSKTEPVLSAVLLHILIVNIHPMANCNGRLARAYEFAAFRASGLYIPWYWEPECLAHIDIFGYYHTLQRSHELGHIDDVVNFLLDLYLSVGEGYLKKIKCV